MKAYAVTMFCEPIEEIDVADPVPKGTEVVIDVTRCGLCHSDLHLQDGNYDLGDGKVLNLAERGVKMPVILGHETLGRLSAKGPEAPIGDDQIGKTFLVYPWLGCGECELCREDRENMCAKPNSIGVHRPGGYAQKCVVPHPKYLVDVTGIDPTLASTYACSGLTAYSALRKLDIDKEKAWLLILGLGGVGMSGLVIARALGFKNIAVADIDEGKRKLAETNGASLVLDPREADALEKLAAIGGVAGAVDFVGSRPTAEFGIAALKKGGTYVVVGLYGGSVSLSLPLLVLRAINLKSSYVGNLVELRELIDLVKAGKIAPMPVETVPIAKVNEAIARLRSGKVSGRLVLAQA